MKRLGQSGVVVGMSMLAMACGRKGPLIYPDMLVPAAPAAVTARQSGSAVKLQFALPEKDRAGRPVQGVAGVKISKRTTDDARKDVCRSCMTDYRLFRTLYLDLLPTDTQRFGSQLILLDGDVLAGNIYSYSIVPFTADGIDGAASAVADVRVGASLPAPSVTIESFPTEVKLWLSSQPFSSGHLLGYNLYRTSGTTPRSYQPLNREPLKGSVYVDNTLERGVKYRYSARTVQVLESGGIAESAESQEVEGMLKDDE
jgi:predicted small lipoprotein YifL